MYATFLGMTTLLASDGWHPWFLIFPLFWILLFFFCFRFFWWGGPWGRRYRGRGQRVSAQEILAARYARGEISHEEYRDRLSHLEGR
jgi:putative membrane protein